jgi:flagellar basal-body rod protein FlgC
MFGSLDISVSALVAQRTRLDAISANIAGMDAIVDERGENNPYKRRVPIFAVGDPSTGSATGVHVREILEQPAFREVYDPTHPLADVRTGTYLAPDISEAMEMVSALEASRAYEANITVVEASKSMMNTALRLLA